MKKSGREKACWNLGIAQANLGKLLEWMLSQREVNEAEVVCAALKKLEELQSWYKRQHEILERG